MIYFPDFLRAIVSTTAEILLMMMLLQPKYSKKAITILMVSVIIANLGTSFYCYLQEDLTLLSKLNIIFLTAFCLPVRPFFKDTFMQWLFTYLTVLNISGGVIVLSFLGSRWLPYPMYANSLLRAVLFGVIFVVLVRYVRPLYRQAVEHWTAYFAVALSLYTAICYFIFSTDDIVSMLTEQAIPLILIICIGTAAYMSIFLSLKNMQREYAIKEENHRMQAERDYMQLAAANMSRRLALIEEASAVSMRATHDRRHFNNVLLGLLESHRIEEAAGLLRNDGNAAANDFAVFCDNPVINAAVSYYAMIAGQAGIRTDISLDFPCDTPVDDLEFSMAISNLMENAYNACLKLPCHRNASIRLVCRHAGRLLLEIENPCGDVTLDETGLPLSGEEGHGVGTKSIQAFVKKYDGELFYSAENGVFRVRLII